MDWIFKSLNELARYLRQDPGCFMDHCAEAADLRVWKVPCGRIFERLEREALRGLAEGEVDVLVGDAASGGEAEGAVGGEVLWAAAEDGWLSESLWRKINKVAELQLAWVGTESSAGVISESLRGEGLLRARRHRGEALKWEGIWGESTGLGGAEGGALLGEAGELGGDEREEGGHGDPHQGGGDPHGVRGDNHSLPLTHSLTGHKLR